MDREIKVETDAYANVKSYRIKWQLTTVPLILLGLTSTQQCALAAGGARLSVQTTVPQAVERMIVKYKAPSAGAGVMSASQASVISRVAGIPLTPYRTMSGDAQVVTLPGKLPFAQADAIAQKLMKDPSVLYAEPDRLVTIQAVPNDPLFVNQWQYFAPGSALGGANLTNAWNQTKGVAINSVVAVIDTGILAHADLVGRILPGYDFITDPIMANDGNGRDANPADPGDWTATSSSSWHGTHVAGTIGAATNNLLGVSGVNWNARILPVRVLGKGGGYTSDIIDGMRWAAGLAVVGAPANANPAKVLSLSLGGAGACGIAMQTAINQVIAAGAVVVVAAGNSNANVSGFTPANCAGVIAVAANNRLAKKTYYSNFGALVTISAPGGDATVDGGILSTLDGGTTRPLRNNGYAYYQGTSMATPHVSGIVSLMRSVRPTLTPLQVKNILRGSARHFSVGSGCTTAICGAGIVDANNAVAAARGVPLLESSALAVNFGKVPIGTTITRIVNVINFGVAPAMIGTVTPAAGFTTTGCAGLTLLPNARCALAVSFSPLAAGLKNGSIAVASNSLKAVNIAVSGNGINPSLEVFPAQGVMPVGWKNSVGSSSVWRVASDTASQGVFSLKSGVITHLQNSTIEVTRTVPLRAVGNLTFARRVSSEANWDFLRFYIDGVQVASWSGTMPWQTVTYPVSAGTHTFKWSYTKDGSVNAGSDAAWIDAVIFP